MLLLVVGLGVVTLGAELLVRGASRLALRLGFSELFVGLTIVGAGTSSPELAASVSASVKGLNDIAVGNVIGSNIFNILIIIGAAALLAPISIAWTRVRLESRWMVLAGLTPFAVLLTGGVIGPVFGAVLVVLLGVYLAHMLRVSRALVAADLAQQVTPQETHARPAVLPNAGWVVLGLGLLVLGSVLFVDSAATIGRGLGISERVIGLTIVAAGTSMPELATSVVAAYRKRPEIAVGNILGSNVFNVFGILGVSALVEPQTLGTSVLAVDAPVMLGASVALTLLLARVRPIGRWAGAALLAGYGLYLSALLWA
ncbi:MAG: calcium/sodium antiporter [Phycisphaerales bacterium]